MWWLIDNDHPPLFLFLGLRVSFSRGKSDRFGKRGFDRLGSPFLCFPFRFGPLGNPNRNETILHDVSWVGNGPLDAISFFSSDSAEEIPHLSVGRK